MLYSLAWPALAYSPSAGQLNEMDNVKAQRLATLGQRVNRDGIRKAYEFVTAGNRSGRFRGMVYGPILLEVQVQNKQHGIYLEENCPRKVNLPHANGLWNVQLLLAVYILPDPTPLFCAKAGQRVLVQSTLRQSLVCNIIGAVYHTLTAEG